MSDKHKDAQGELPELPAAYSEIVFGELHTVPGYTADQMRGYALDHERALARRASQVSAAAPADLLTLTRYDYEQIDGESACIAEDNAFGKYVLLSDVEALFRASEGQAQASAAPVIAWYADTTYNANEDKQGDWPVELHDHRAISLGAERPRAKWDWKPLVEPLAAQLADSTAPGAPDGHVTPQQAAAAGVECGDPDCSGCPGPGECMYAAPTAQQSLTAGGAVPLKTWEQRRIESTEEVNDMPIGKENFMLREIADLRAALAAAPLPQVQPSEALFDFHAHLARQAAWSGKTFGPGPRTLGVCDHIRKELLEIEADPLDLKEWIDAVILALDGAWRCGGTPAQIIDGIVTKQTKNEGRAWPDWRTMDPNKAIEHDRSKDQQPVTPSGALGDSNGGVEK